MLFSDILEENPYLIRFGEQKIPGLEQLSQCTEQQETVSQCILSVEELLKEYISLEVCVATQFGEIHLLTVHSNGDIYFHEEEMKKECDFIASCIKDKCGEVGVSYFLFCEMESFKNIMRRGRIVREGEKQLPAPIPKYVMLAKNNKPILYKQLTA